MYKIETLINSMYLMLPFDVMFLNKPGTYQNKK